MPTKLILFCLLALPALAFADAGDGQFMGYELGENYPTPSQNSTRTTTGNLLIVAQNPVKPADIEQVSLIASPVSQTISFIDAASWHATEDEARETGRRYVELLRTIYPDWRLGGEVMDASLRIVEVNLDKSPHNLRFRLVRDEHNGRNMWRFSMSLGWKVDSAEWLAWQEMSAIQQAADNSPEHNQLLQDSDVRGL